MKLMRLAILYFQSIENKQLLQNWELKMGDIKIVAHKIGNAPEIKNKQRILISAHVDLAEWPKKNQDNYIEVPDTERRRAEAAIESIANLIAISERCHRSISSPFPCVALLPANENELMWLETSEGFAGCGDLIPDAPFHLEFDDKLLASLSDRMDGVALLAEALANKHATGKYHEFVRLFERAFQLNFSKLAKKLSQFLKDSGFGYERDEIESWIKFRDAATHADEKKSQHLVLEADIMRFIPRMEQAAYDLLLNKKSWRDRSSERRNVWKPNEATISSQNDIQVLQKEKGGFRFQMFDEFKCYPFDINAKLNSLPENAWSKWGSPNSRPLGEVRMNVITS